jgi:hypothetical protein
MRNNISSKSRIVQLLEMMDIIKVIEISIKKQPAHATLSVAAEQGATDTYRFSPCLSVFGYAQTDNAHRHGERSRTATLKGQNPGRIKAIKLVYEKSA